MHYYGSSKETLKVELVERLKKWGVGEDSIFVSVLNRWVFGGRVMVSKQSPGFAGYLGRA